MNSLSAAKNRRVLVIDDNAAIHDDFRKILVPAVKLEVNTAEVALFGPSDRVVQEIRFDVDSAYQGRDGAQLVKAALAAGQPYALAFVDVRMPPGWDGVETTRKIWELDSHLQIVICTAYSDYSWREMFEQLGQRDGLLILKKPFDAVEAFQLAYALTEKWWLHQQARRKMEELESRVAERTAELAKANADLQAENTGRKRTEEQLRVQTTALDAAANAIVITDHTGTIEWVNRAFTGLTGYPPEEAVGQNPRVLKAGNREAAFYRNMWQTIASGQVWSGELTNRRKDGSIYEEAMTITPLRDAAGVITRYVAIKQDVSERKRSEVALQESKRFLQSTLDAISSHIAILDEDGRIVEVNAAWQSFARANQFIGGHWGVGVNYLQLCDTASGACSVEAAAVAAGIRSVMAAQQDEFHLEYSCHSPQEQRWFIARVTRFGGPGPVRVVVAHENITERKQAEHAVRASDEKFRQLADHITDAFWIRSPDLREVHYISPAFEQIWGRPVASLYANPQQWADFILPEDREWVEAAFAALTRAAPSLDIKYRIVRPAGEIRWVRVRGFQVRDAAHNLIRHAGIVTDITESKQADEILQQRETLYRAAIAGAGAVPYSLDFRTGSYGFIGAGIQELIGYAPPEVSGQLWKQIIQESVMAGESAGLSKQEATRRMASGEIRNWRCDMRVRTRDGQLRWLSDSSVQHLDAAGHAVGSMGILQDITERKQNEIAALAFSKLGARLSSVTSARETFAIIKEVSQELFAWDAFCVRLYSAQTDSFYSGFTIDTIAGHQVAEEQSDPVKPGELYRRIIDQGGELIRRDQPPAFGSDTVPFGDVSHPSAALMFVPIRSRGHVVGILSVQSYTPDAYHEPDLKTLQTLADQCGGAIERIWADDALRQTQAQLFQSQKLETVGKLAGGVAHEFNSILTAIIGQSELILGDLPPGHPLAENATEIHKSAERAATLTRQLLAYGRRTLLQPESLDLNQVLASMEAPIRHLVGGAVDVRIVPTPNLRPVKADAGQIEQVIVNLVMNAAAAMPHGGKLTLETGNVTFAPESIGPDTKPGDYTMLAVTDTGTGMSAAVRARVFEPFYTTKGVGEGTGLGLSTCYGIIKQSGGHISVYSEPGRGTTFKVYLPQPAVQTPLPARPPVVADLPRGTETILLVEDDPALREVAATLLRRLGYTVLTAANGVEALSLNQQRAAGPLALLFTDVVMPHLSGRELADRMRALDPHTKILFTSAYTEQSVVHQGVLDPGVALLQKPFTPSALAHKVREVLDQPIASPPDSAQ